MVNAVKGTARFRKGLRAAARQGQHTLLFKANKKDGFPVIVQVGETQHLLSNHANAAEAIAWCERKMGRTPRKLIVRKAA